MATVEIQLTDGRRVVLDGQEAERVLRLAKAKAALEDARELELRLKPVDLAGAVEDALAGLLESYGFRLRIVQRVDLLVSRDGEPFTLVMRRDAELIRVTPGDASRAPAKPSGSAGSQGASGRNHGWRTDAPTSVVKEVFQANSTAEWQGASVALRSKAVRDALKAKGYSVWQE